MTSGKFLDHNKENYSLDKRLDISLTHFGMIAVFSDFLGMELPPTFFIWQTLKQRKEFIFISDLFPLTTLKKYTNFPFYLFHLFNALRVWHEPSQAIAWSNSRNAGPFQ